MYRIALILTGFLLGACLFSACPSLIVDDRNAVVYDTLVGGGTIEATAVNNENAADSVLIDTVYLPVPFPCTHHSANDTAGEPTVRAWVPKFFRSIYNDSLITIRATAQMDDDTCKVSQIRIDYSLRYPTIKSPLIENHSGQKLASKREYFALMEPYTNGTQSGLFLGIQAQGRGTIYGGQYDPFSKSIKFQLGKKFGQ